MGPLLRRHPRRLLPRRARARSTSPALYQEDGEYRYQGGWNVRAFVAAAIGALFSSILPTYGPAGYGAALGPYTWFIGVLVAGAIYFGVSGGKSRLVGSGEPAV